MARYFLEISYNGTPYHGWQRQPNAITIQQVLEEKLSTILRSTIHIVGAGRTDTGVHAKQIMAHFDFVDQLETDKLVYKMNSILPAEIAIQKIKLVPPEAHARFDATSRCYEYLISLKKDPFLIRNAYYVKKPLDLDVMNKAANILLNHTNFKCFSKSKTDVKTYNCNIAEAFWKKEGDVLVFRIRADRFLRNMVRAITGTLLEVGSGKRKVADMHEIIESKNRSNAGVSVPAKGLYLTQVKYPNSIFDE